MLVLSTEIPIRTVSETNARDHWSERHRRRAKIRKVVAYWLSTKVKGVRLPCLVRMIRVAASNGLDDDNLVAACKPVRDGIADALGVDDRTASIRWQYCQKRGSRPMICIQIENLQSADAQRTLEVVRGDACSL